MRNFISLGLVLILAACTSSANSVAASETPAGSSQSASAPPAQPTPSKTNLPGLIVTPATATSSPTSTIAPALLLAREKIKHIIVIMQENRSFDQYFGTYPARGGRFPGPERSVHGLHP